MKKPLIGYGLFHKTSRGLKMNGYAAQYEIHKLRRAVRQINNKHLENECVVKKVEIKILD